MKVIGKNRIIYFIFIILFMITGCTAKEAVNKRKILFYVNPMNPAVHSDKPMKDQMGMDYIPVYEKIRVDSNAVRQTVKSTAGKDNVISSVVLSAEDEQKISLQTTKAVYKSLEREIKSVGKVNYDEKKWVHVSARIAGRIEKLYVNFTGMKVQAGQPLLSIYSPSLITAEKELLQTYQDYTNTLSENQQETMNISQQLFEASKNKLKLWGLSEDQIVEILKKGETLVDLTINSPISGTVIKMYATSGMYMNEGDMLYEIANLNRVWIEAEIYEQDIGLLRKGLLMDVTSVSYPGKNFHGAISFIDPVLDPVTRTVKVRAEFDNSDELLKPGMYVDASIKIPLGKKTLVIPQTAVLDTGVRKIVYVYQGNGKYEGRTVLLDNKVGDYYPVISGIREGEQVVTYGTYLIDSQAQLSGNSYIEYNDQ